jgi:plastocyanin
VFIAASEGSTTPAVIIAAGITIAILVGAAVISALPNIRTSSLVIGMCGVMVVLLLSGSIVLGTSEPEKEAGGGGYVEPTGEAVPPPLEVDALPTLSFQSKAFTVGAGIREVHYVDKGGTHTLVFENAFPGFELQVPTGTSTLKVEFKEGEKFTIYCTIPGHRAAGMEATVTVGPAAAAPGQPGTETPTPTTTAPGTTATTNRGNPTTDPADQSGNSTGS